MGHADLHAQLHDHFNHRRYDEIAARLAPAFLYEDLGRHLTIKTAGEFIDFLRGWTSAFSDVSVGEVSYHEGADVSVATFHGRGTNDGPLTEGMPVTGRAMDVPFCEVLQYDGDGAVTHGELYYDQMTMLTQLGLVTPPGDETASDPADTVRALFAEMDRGDFAAMLDRMDDDAQGVDEISQSWIRGLDALQEYMSRVSSMVSEVRSEVSDLTTRVMGDHALVTCWLEQNYLADGHETHVSSPTTIALRRDGTDWRVLLVHTVPVEGG